MVSKDKTIAKRMNLMEYKGYTGVVAFDSDAGIFHGEVIDLQDMITFQGTCVEDLRQAFQDSVEDYLAFCAEIGREPEKPFSGKFVLRIEPGTHREISIRARGENLSINQWIGKQLEKALEE